jgi:hypothetical protein
MASVASPSPWTVRVRIDNRALNPQRDTPSLGQLALSLLDGGPQEQTVLVTRLHRRP